MKKICFNHSSIQLFNPKSPYVHKKAFTLAEVLITLVIIGVVAAITVPMLHNSTNDKQYSVGMQKARSTIGEAYRQATINNEITKNITSAKDFVDEVLAKRYLKIVKSCDNAIDCGFTSKIKRPDGKEVDIDKNMTESTDAYAVTQEANIHSGSSTKNFATIRTTNPTTESYSNPAYFQTLDGLSVKIFYNPFCATNGKDKAYIYSTSYDDSNSYPQMSLDVACLYGVYDMNGAKGPNTVGKDIGFIGSLYNGYEAISVATLPYNGTEVLSSEAQGTSGTNYCVRAMQYCQNRDNDKNWILPDINELTLIYLNRYMVTDTNTSYFWSRSQMPNAQRYFRFSNGERSWAGCGNDNMVLCVRNSTLN